MSDSPSHGLTPGPPAGVLLVDDQPANLLALEAVLGDLGLTLVKAGSGSEALRRLEAEDFAVVLLDVQMHGLDGFQTARLIRDRDRSRHTAIIFLTAYDVDRSVVEQAYALGAVDFLVKPLVPVILRAKVQGFVELHQKTEQVRSQAERLRQLDRRAFDEAVREGEARKAAMVETALDCIITIDHEDRVVEFNPAAERTFGYARADVLGKPMAELIVPSALRERHYEGLRRYLATGEGPVLNRRIEMVAVRADGTEFPVELAITRIPTSGPPLFTGYLRDISDRQRADRRRAARLAITETLAEAESLDAAIGPVLRAVCEGLGWEVAAFWKVDGPVLRCAAVWHAPAVPAAEFERVSRQVTFAPGVGLPGRIWASGQPVWIADIERDAGLPRAPIILGAGLHGAFGVPVLLGKDVLGVIEVFRRQRQEPDGGRAGDDGYRRRPGRSVQGPPAEGRRTPAAGGGPGRGRPPEGRVPDDARPRASSATPSSRSATPWR
jgi:PAS domain S-box-containing protein